MLRTHPPSQSALTWTASRAVRQIRPLSGGWTASSPRRPPSSRAVGEKEQAANGERHGQYQRRRRVGRREQKQKEQEEQQGFRRGACSSNPAAGLAGACLAAAAVAPPLPPPPLPPPPQRPRRLLAVGHCRLQRHRLAVSFVAVTAAVDRRRCSAFASFCFADGFPLRHFLGRVLVRGDPTAMGLHKRQGASSVVHWRVRSTTERISRCSVSEKYSFAEIQRVVLKVFKVGR